MKDAAKAIRHLQQMILFYIAGSKNGLGGVVTTGGRFVFLMAPLRHEPDRDREQLNVKGPRYSWDGKMYMEPNAPLKVLPH